MNTTAIPPVAYGPVPNDQPRFENDQLFAGQRAPSPPVKSEQFCCPHCNRPPMSTFGKLRAGFVQLGHALIVIVLSVLRLARLVVAGVFTLLGLIGCGFYVAGQRVAHPDDRKLLPGLPVGSDD